MKGHISEEALAAYTQLVADSLGVDFSEGGDTYDFTRCVRPDGSSYGSRGKCRKGTEAGAKQEAPVKGRGLVTDPKELTDLKRRASEGDREAIKRLMEHRDVTGLKPARGDTENQGWEQAPGNEQYKKQLEKGYKAEQKAKETKLGPAGKPATKGYQAPAYNPDPEGSAKMARAMARKANDTEAEKAADTELKRIRKANRDRVQKVKDENAARAVAKRRPEEDMRRPNGLLIGTSPRNMAIDTLSELRAEAADYKRQFAHRAGEELIGNVMKMYEDRIQKQEKYIQDTDWDKR
jgi:hypothetical protein